MASDEEVGRQILSIFMQHKVGASGVLRRNHFIDVRDADFQRGLNKAVENRWIKIKLRDRYTYELTEAGLAAGLNAGLLPKPLGSRAPRGHLAGAGEPGGVPSSRAPCVKRRHINGHSGASGYVLIPDRENQEQ